MSKHRKFTSEEIAFIMETYPAQSRSETLKLFNARFSPPINDKHLDYAACRHGIRSGASNNRPAGYSRRIKGKYALIKTDSGEWKLAHAIAWEAANGKLPKGRVIIFADGDASNLRPDNLLLLTRAELGFMNRNGLRSSDPDITRLGKEIASLRIAAGKAAREKLGTRLDKFDEKEKRRRKQGARSE